MKTELIFMSDRARKLKSYSKLNTFWASIMNIYNFGVFTEKPYGESLERYVVYILISTLSHAASVTSKYTMVDVGAVPQPAELHVDVLLLQF